MAYCVRANVYALGLPPEAFARPPRIVEGVDAAAGRLLVRAHGLSANDPVTLLVQSSSALGADPSALPGGLSEGVTYYAQPSGSDALTLSATAGGTSIASFADVGVGAFGFLIDVGAIIDQHIDDAAAVIEEHLTAHTGPVSAAVLAGLNARMAARSLAPALGLGNPVYAKAYESVEAMRMLDDRMLARWAAGKPVKGAADATVSTVENGAVAVVLEGGGWRQEGDEYRV